MNTISTPIKRRRKRNPPKLVSHIHLATNPFYCSMENEKSGRPREVKETAPEVQQCKKLHRAGVPLYRIAILAGVDYDDVQKWWDKGWIERA